MKYAVLPVCMLSLFIATRSGAGEPQAGAFQPVPALGFRVVRDFFHTPPDQVAGESSAVALNSRGHIFLFQRTQPMLSEYDAHGTYLRSLGEGEFMHPHGP